MSGRVVPLASTEAGDSRMTGTVAQRLDVVAQLTSLGWTLTKKPLPSYTRRTMPVIVTTLLAQDDRD